MLLRCYLTIHPFTLVIIFGWFIDSLISQYQCFCNCCARKPCALAIQDKTLVNKCDACEPSCRQGFSECQSSANEGKIFGLCSTSVSQEGKRLGKNDYATVKAADALLGTTEDGATLEQQLNELRASYEEKVKADTTDDHMPIDEHPVQTAIEDEPSTEKSINEEVIEVEEKQMDVDTKTTTLLVTSTQLNEESKSVNKESEEETVIEEETDSTSSVIPHTTTLEEKIDIKENNDNIISNINDAVLPFASSITTNEQTIVKSFVDASVTSTLPFRTTTDTIENIVTEKLPQSPIEQQGNSDLKTTSEPIGLPVALLPQTVVTTSTLSSSVSHVSHVTIEPQTINPTPEDVLPDKNVHKHTSTITSTSSSTSETVNSDTIHITLGLLTQTTTVEKQTESLIIAPFVRTSPSMITKKGTNVINDEPENISHQTLSTKQLTIPIYEPVFPIFDTDSSPFNSFLPSSTTQSTGIKQNVQLNQSDTSVNKSDKTSSSRGKSNGFISSPTASVILAIPILSLIFIHQR